MKVIKDKKLEFRLTAEEKNRIKAYAEKRGIKMSQAVRLLCEKVMNGEVE